MRIGEYFVSLKNYKIPLKSVEKTAQFDVNNPPPPGTEDELPISNDSYVSPLAMINRPSSQQTTEPPAISIQENTNSTQANPSQKPTKRSSLFSKCTILWILFFFCYADISTFI